MTASADRLPTQALNDQTFYLSNMVPQNGSLNSGFWSRLEDAVRGFSETGLVTEAKAVTGGFFYDPAEENLSTRRWPGSIRPDRHWCGGRANPSTKW